MWLYNIKYYNTVTMIYKRLSITSYLVDVSFGESDVSDETPSSEESEEECQANDVSAGSIPDGSVKVRIEVKLLAVILIWKILLKSDSRTSI